VSFISLCNYLAWDILLKIYAMNKIMFTLLLVAATVSGFAQEKNPFPKTITVNGSAELEIVPDEIYVQVDLKEYEKKGQPKVNIDQIRQDFLATAKAVGLPDSAITIAAYDGYNGNPWLRKKNKKEELLASITYQIKLKSSRQMDDLVNRLDDNATQNFAIVRTSHSRIVEIRKQLKIEAIRQAKEKAQYLAAAIDEQVGPAVTITEPQEFNQPVYAMRSNMAMKTSGYEDNAAAVDFQKIKFRYEVSVVFALK
jgi:uncharacterized protein YggE